MSAAAPAADAHALLEALSSRDLAWLVEAVEPALAGLPPGAGGWTRRLLTLIAAELARRGDGHEP